MTLRRLSVAFSCLLLGEYRSHWVKAPTCSKQYYALHWLVLCLKLVLNGNFSRYQFRGRTVSLRHFGQCFFKSVCRKHHIFAQPLHTFTYNLAHQQINPHHPHLRGVCFESRFFFLFDFILFLGDLVHLVVDRVVRTLGIYTLCWAFSVCLRIYGSILFHDLQSLLNICQKQHLLCYWR